MENRERRKGGEEGHYSRERNEEEEYVVEEGRTLMGRIGESWKIAGARERKRRQEDRGTATEGEHLRKMKGAREMWCVNASDSVWVAREERKKTSDTSLAYPSSVKVNI